MWQRCVPVCVCGLLLETSPRDECGDSGACGGFQESHCWAEPYVRFNLMQPQMYPVSQVWLSASWGAHYTHWQQVVHRPKASLCFFQLKPPLHIYVCACMFEMAHVVRLVEYNI